MHNRLLKLDHSRSCLFIAAFVVGLLPLWQQRDVVADPLPRKVAPAFTGSPTEFDYADRDDDIRIQDVMDWLRMRSGSVAADIGAGGGWFTMRAARRVGPTGLVYAEEILPKYTNFIQQRARQNGFHNVRTILGTLTDPKLPPNSLDAVLILNAYHEFEYPLVMLRHIRDAMKPGARLGFIERDDAALRAAAELAYAKTGKIERRINEPHDGNPFIDDHRLALPIVRREAESVGFKYVEHSQLGGDQYCLIVEK